MESEEQFINQLVDEFVNSDKFTIVEIVRMAYEAGHKTGFNEGYWEGRHDGNLRS